MKKGFAGLGGSVVFWLLITVPMTVYAQSHADSLRQALEQQGWQSQEEADGSLVFQPPSTSEPEVADVTPPPSSDLETLLRNQGWQVQTADDGGLIVELPMMEPEAPEQPQPPEAAEVSSKEVAPTPPREDSPPSAPDTGGTILTPAQAEQQGGLRHWHMETEPDGSVVLRPRSTDVETAPTASLTPCPGTDLSIPGMELPVDNYSEAHALAAAWLERAGVESAVVGRIRKILKVYIISIVKSDPPHLLLHQIAVRASDGHVLMLH